MTTAMIRKKYITPEVEVFDVELENMVAASLSIGEGDIDEELSNKRKPVNNSPWDSSNWSTNE